MKFLYLNFLILCILIASCHPAKKLSEIDHNSNVKKLDSCNVDCLLTKITANQNLHYFMGKGSIRYQFENERQDARITLYAIKDSLCLISLKKLGVEAFRILLMPDHILVIDRLNQEYSNLNYSDLQNQYQLEIKFDWLQNLLSSGCFIKEAMDYQMIDSALNLKLKGNSKSYAVAYTLSNPEVLCKDFKLENSQYALNFIVSDYLKLENRSIPSKFKIEFESIDRSVLNLDLIWDEIKLDPIIQVKFNIPDHYKKR